MLFGRPWPIERLVPQWGSPCIVHRQYDERSPAGHGKLAMPGEVGYFAGFDFSGRGVHIINADTCNVYLAHSCIPLEYLDIGPNGEGLTHIKPEDFDDDSKYLLGPLHDAPYLVF